MRGAVLLGAWMLTTALGAAEPAAPATSREALQLALARAQQAFDRDQPAALVQALDDAQHLARAQAPLAVSALTPVAEAPQGLGMYEPLPGGEVRGDTLLLYAEVRNFGLRSSQGPDGTPRHEMHLVTDAAFFYDDGEPIAARKAIGEHRLSSRTRADVTFVVVELGVKGLPAQPYLVELTLRDQVSGKSGKARVPFVVQGATAAPPPQRPGGAKRPGLERRN